MKKQNKLTTLTTALAAALLSSHALANDILSRLSVPTGYELSYFAKDVENARQMAVGKDRTVYVGSRKAGKVHALIDNNRDGVADKKILVADGLNMPSGIALKDGDLYVAEVERIVRFKQIAKNLKAPVKEVVFDDLPDKRHHGWKYLTVSPEGELIIPVGVPCNICAEDPKFGRIFSLNLQTKQLSTIAKGVRNSVGFDYHPVTGKLWFSDNGRDMMGDDIPPCEINRVDEVGQHFGFPYVHGGSVLDPEFGEGKSVTDYTMPALALQAHVAPLGIHFYRGEQFPKAMKHQLFVAEHGSWNRSKKVGYRVMLANVENGKITSYEPFLTGFMENETTYGRPAAVAELSDGSLLVSDDYANAIYRISYNNK
ncbi:PQQ-dependent sugar dehydrogenase [Pseudoalteromonas piscicida]|uniref:Sorbosone dehydrogenase n=1 Tax=Pseudoalteromonas piscicida TaxID=43662 RepID=A0A2A5JWE1_PSEO7|nr:PQQ-dependent sugar dehydrogenase [Pseudoalteromonas piscicida]PCK33730.1 sorbosone dehydrogenase [Pseudoalteromonas piscicida]